MKIGLLLASREEGGLENHVIDLANGLVGLGEDVVLFADPRYFDRCDPRVSTVAINADASRRNFVTRSRIRRAIVDSGVEVVHAHAGKAASILAQSARALRAAGIRTVSTIHGLKGSLQTYAASDHVIGVSHGVVAAMPPAIHHTVVYNGVSAPPFERRTRAELAALLNCDKQTPISIAVGRLAPVKAYDVLIDCWRDSFGTLAIIGEGPEEATLRARSEGKSIVFTGFRSDVRSWYPAADLMLFSSSREGFSYAMAEALRAELPIVSTDVPGAREILPKELLATRETLAATIESALSDLEQTRRLSAPVFEWANQTLTVEAMVAAVRDVYSTVLTG